jgi:hypothetical protein
MKRTAEAPRARLRRLTLAIGLACVSSASFAQTVIDRVVARVGEDVIFSTDVKAALGLGVVTLNGAVDPEQAAVEQLIDRRLMLTEILRGVPPEPDPEAIDAEVARMRSYAATTLKSLMQANGFDERLLRLTARDTLRIQLYVDTRFPQLVVSESEAEQYFRAHPSAFRRNGEMMTFNQAAGAARELASQERRATRISQWVAGLRKRTEISRPAGGG